MNDSTSPCHQSIIARIAERQAALNKSDQQLAEDLGIERESTFVMIKQGKLKLPIQKVAKLAEALSIAPDELLRQFMQETMPETLAAVDALFQTIALSLNERTLLDSYRYLSKGYDVKPTILDGKSIIALVVM